MTFSEIKPTTKIFLVLASVAVLSGCSGFRHLNDPAKSQVQTDPLSSSGRSAPYHTIVRDGFSVSYNMSAVSGRIPMMRLSLIIRNLKSETQEVRPQITVRNAAGFVLQPYSHEAFMAMAASMAGTSIPAIPSQDTAQTYYSSGTVTNTYTGSTYTYSGTTATAPNFGASFAQGFNQGLAMGAIAQRNAGYDMMNWGSSYWLKSQYLLPAGGGQLQAA